MTTLLAPSNKVDTSTVRDEGKSLEAQRVALEKSWNTTSTIDSTILADAEGFNPIIADHEYAPSGGNKLKQVFGFNTSPYGSYYNVLRTQQYLWQAFAPLAGAVITSGVLQKWKDGGEFFKELLAVVSGNEPLLSEADRAQRGYNTADVPIKDKRMLQPYYNIQATALISVSVGRTWLESAHIVDDFRLSLAAEFGKDKNEVGMEELLHSHNPIINIETNRSFWKFVSRASSGAGFYFGLTPGLVSSALNIGAERTLFFTNTPYDILSKAVNDVQYNHLSGEMVQQTLVKEFQKALQGMYADRGKNMVSEEDMHALRPVLEKVAQDVIDKRIGVESIFGVIGGGIVVVGNPKQSEINYDFVSKHMMESVVELAKQRRMDAQSVVNDKKIWDYELREGGTKYVPTGTATTARPDFVEAERNRLSEKEFNNLGMRARM